MKDDDFKLLKGFVTDRRTDICECRVAFATENASVLIVLNLDISTSSSVSVTLLYYLLSPPLLMNNNESRD